MANLTSGTSWTGEATLTKQTGTVLTLPVSGKYIDRDAQFTLNVRSLSGTLSASADANVESTDNGIGGVNIYSAIGTKTTTKPSSGYYIRTKATGSGSFTVTTPGWLGSGTISPASGDSTVFFPIAAGTASVSGTNTVTPSASVSGSNITLSNTNNGISVTATGGGTASASASAVSSAEGYIPANQSIGSTTINADSQTTTAVSYISGVTIPVPQSGTNSFSITLPNGNNDTLTLTFVVDSEGNYSIE